MEKYYIIREDGSSIFELPYPKDFCIHCLFLLQEDGHRYILLHSLFAFQDRFSCSDISSPGRIAGGEIVTPRTV